MNRARLDGEVDVTEGGDGTPATRETAALESRVHDAVEVSCSVPR